MITIKLGNSGGTYESNLTNKIWISGRPSAQRCGKTHPEGESSSGQGSCRVHQRVGLPPHESQTIFFSSDGWRGSEAKRYAFRKRRGRTSASSWRKRNAIQAWRRDIWVCQWRFC